MDGWMDVCVYVFMYVCMFVCTYVCIRLYHTNQIASSMYNMYYVSQSSSRF